MNEAGNDGTGNALAALSGEIANAVRRAGECLAVAIEGMPASALDYAQLYYIRDHHLTLRSRLDGLLPPSVSPEP